MTSHSMTIIGAVPRATVRKDLLHQTSCEIVTISRACPIGMRDRLQQASSRIAIRLFSSKRGGYCRHSSPWFITEFLLQTATLFSREHLSQAVITHHCGIAIGIGHRSTVASGVVLQRCCCKTVLSHSTGITSSSDQGGSSMHKMTSTIVIVVAVVDRMEASSLLPFQISITIVVVKMPIDESSRTIIGFDSSFTTSSIVEISLLITIAW